MLKNHCQISLMALSKFSQYKIIEIKNDVVIATYKQISLKITLIIGTVGN